MKTSTPRLTLVTPPASAPVTLAEAKAWLRVDHDAEDDLIGALISAAVAALDGRTGFLGRCLDPQTWDLTLDRFPVAEIQIPLGPVASVEAITFIDAGGAEQTVAPDDYTLDRTPTYLGWVVPTGAWPATMETINAVRVRFVAGTGTPEPVRQALLDMVAGRYDARGDGRLLTPGIVADLAAFRRPVVLAHE